MSLKNTKKEIKKLCQHLNIEVYEEYLNHCRKIVWRNPRKTRFSVDWWDENRIKKVKNKMKKYDFMDGYKK